MASHGYRLVPKIDSMGFFVRELRNDRVIRQWDVSDPLTAQMLCVKRDLQIRNRAERIAFRRKVRVHRERWIE